MAPRGPNLSFLPQLHSNFVLTPYTLLPLHPTPLHPNQARGGVRSLVLTVQSTVADCAELTDAIFRFLEGFSLDMISDQRLAGYVEGLVARKRQRDTRLATEVSRHWNEIVIGRCG